HDKHHNAYVDNLNKTIAAYPDLQRLSIEELLRDLDHLPEAIRAAVRNNGGGHYNHTLFWEIMKPGGANEPSGALADAVKKRFDSVAALKDKMTDAALKRFGSGWSWLVVDGGGD